VSEGGGLMRGYIALGIFLALLAVGTYLFHKGGAAKETAVVIETAETVQTVVEKKDEIRNRRPDRAGVIDSLQRGSF